MLEVRVYGCVFALSYCCFMLLAVAQITDPSEVTALIAVKSSLIDPMDYLQNWNNGDPCTSNWNGVTCADAGTDGYFHVWGLLLLKMNLSGTLAPELGQLSHLKILDFMWNEITGSIPKEIGNIAPLELLLLNGNKLSGSFPEELGYLSNLDRLQVDENNISGPIPKSFANLSKIKHFYLNNNSISGQMPSELSKLSTLLHLLLDNNNVSGYLPPEFASLSELRVLQLDNYNFKGTEVPASYGNMSRLMKLSLRNCSLQGAVPDLSRIPTLRYLDLSVNQLTGAIPSNKLSDDMTTIDLSHNQLNGSIPGSFSDLPCLQRLSLENNILTGSVPASIWLNMSFNTTAILTLDLRNNSLSTIAGDLTPPDNVTLRLQGNPVCNNGNVQNIGQFCGSKNEGDGTPESSTNSTMNCLINACPVNSSFEYVPASPVPCFCAAPLRIGYRLKSPSFSYFPPYLYPFEMYVTSSLNLDRYQLSIDSVAWEEGPRLRMYLKLFPMFIDDHSNTFNTSEIQRIRGIFTSWRFPGSDLFGPYELLNFTLLEPYSNVSKGRPRLWLIVGVPVVSVIVLTVIFILCCLRWKQYCCFGGKNGSSQDGINQNMELLMYKAGTSTVAIDELSGAHKLELSGKKGHELLLFNFSSIEVATDHFSEANKLGQGGFGPVYKGKLIQGQEIAVKRLARNSRQGLEEFKNEIVLISKLQHRNLVRLLGCCTQGEERMLIYEYLPNKSLDSFLFDAAKGALLDWKKRACIIEGIVQGLLYLHKYSRLKIIHRDLKTSNILLDSDMNPKISDFGTARIFGENESRANTNRIVGTYGYMSPEYAMDGIFSVKSDVFSFGVMMLEIISGKKNSGFYQPNRPLNLLGHAWDLYKEERYLELIDPTVEETYSRNEVMRYVQVGLLCVQENAVDRPTMSDVASMLCNDLMTLPSPKQPAFSAIVSVNGANLCDNSTPCSMNNVTITEMGAR